MQHLGSLPTLSPRRAGTVGSRRQAALPAPCADSVSVPACDRSTGGGAVHAAWHAEHHANEHEGASRRVREDEHLGMPRLEILIVVAQLAILRVEEEPRPVPRSAETIGVVAGGGSSARTPPGTARRPHFAPQAFRGCELGAGHEREDGILA